VRVVIVVVAIVNVRTKAVSDAGILRFHQIANATGRPWRDYEVEFPPLQTLTVLLLGRGSVAWAATRVALASFGADVATACCLWRAWGMHTANRYLMLGLPLLIFIYLRLDLVSVLLSVAAVTLVRRGRERGGGVCLAAAILFRLWPIVLLTALITKGRSRALRWAVGSLAVGGLGWVAWGGTAAARQVLTYRGATGWEIGSTIGVVVWMATGGPLRSEAGAFRVGSGLGWSRLPLLGVLAVTLVAVWRKAAKVAVDPFGLPAVASVAALLVCSPILSDSYISWLLPWAAIGTSGRSRRFFVGTLAAAVLTALTFLPSVTGFVALFQTVTLGRNLALIFLIVSWLRRGPNEGR
jgi:hypothetical protein